MTPRVRSNASSMRWAGPLSLVASKDNFGALEQGRSANYKEDDTMRYRGMNART